MNNSKTILKTMLYTMLILLGVACVMVCFMFFVFTKTCADIMYDIGCDRFASSLYYRTYEKNNEIYYCYKALNIKIKLNDNDKVIDYYEEFLEHNKYEEFMDANKSSREKMSIGVLEKSAILNDDNYLTNQYIKALIVQGDSNKAWEIALEEFGSFESFTFDNQGVYALGQFIESKLDSFDDILDNEQISLVEKMQMYFYNIVEIFESHKDTNESIKKAYLMALGNRIINVGQDINAIYSGLEINEDIKTNNENKMIEINNIIKGIL